jgi:uncharacterized GH25 family protein
MTRLRPGLLAVILIAARPGMVNAHYHMLLPDKPSNKTGEVVTLTYQFGHPFEHQFFDTQAPEQIFVLTPDGTKIDLSKKIEKVVVDGVDGKKVTAYRAAFTPEKRGDHIVMALSPPVKVEGEKFPLQDLVKVVVHVQTQNGWDRRAGLPKFPEPCPLTRPYGLKGGMAFRAEFAEPGEGGGRPCADLLVEVERYSPIPPKELPPDEFITGSARTDRIGTATVTLTEPGWWAVTSNRDKDGIRQRGTLWVFVDDKVPLEPVK